MTHYSIRRHANAYLDSVKLLTASRAILETPGFEWGAVVTGTPPNVEVLVEEGLHSSGPGSDRRQRSGHGSQGAEVERAFWSGRELGTLW